MIRVLLQLLVATTLSAQSYRITTTPPAAVDPAQPVPWRITIENISGAARPATRIGIQFTPGTIGNLPPELQCTTAVAGVSCILPALEAGEVYVIDATVQHPFRFGRVFAGASIALEPLQTPESAHETFIYWREFLVTTAADAGPGSLRQTILDINAHPDCQYRANTWVSPCKAAIRIADPVPAEGWYTIRPLSPLPSLTAYDTAIDGSTQTASNPLGPAVALDGSALVFGNGITADGPANAGNCEIRGLAIGGFPWNGVFATPRSQLHVTYCYVGVDPTGRRAHPNGARGIASSLVRGTVANNVISGNARSGVFFVGTPGIGPNIRNNRIGVAAHDDTPVGNGASGVFVGDFFTSYTNPAIEGNVIANNAHFGIAITPRAPILILGNTIRNHGGGGIDIGLDGRTESAPGVPGVEGGVIAPPVILSATYANGVTTIGGFAPSHPNARRQVLLYANSTIEPDGFAEGEQYLGITPVLFGQDATFTFEYAGDLRGRYINGSALAVTLWSLDDYVRTSSEFGRVLAVEE